jgi:hypothetical protein
MINLANAVNADLINYAKLKKFNSQTVVTSMGASHADSGSVDMEKLAALKEKHYLNEMTRQLIARFDLKQGPASRIATIAHQYNRIANGRGLTTEDASRFSKELIGFDMAQVEVAVKKSMKGDSSNLNTLLDQASDKVGTTPEKFNQMITEIFY